MIARIQATGLTESPPPATPTSEVSDKGLLCETVQDVRDGIREFFSKADGIRRTCISPFLAGVIATLGSSMLATADLCRPIPQPTPITSECAPPPFPTGSLPPIDTDPELLAHYLRTPEAIAAFFHQNWRHRNPNDPADFFVSFHAPLAELQRRAAVEESEKIHGCCNQSARTYCTILSRHNYKMYLVSMRPKGWSIYVQPWHQIAVCKIKGTYYVFDNEYFTRWDGTLEEYCAQSGFQIQRIGGVVRWQEVQDNPVARFGRHVRWNEEVEETPPPVFEKEGTPVVLLPEKKTAA